MLMLANSLSLPVPCALIVNGLSKKSEIWKSAVAAQCTHIYTNTHIHTYTNMATAFIQTKISSGTSEWDVIWSAYLFKCVFENLCYARCVFIYAKRIALNEYYGLGFGFGLNDKINDMR